MFIGRFIGTLLLIAAAIVLLRDALAWHDSGLLAFISGQELWGDLSPDSLTRFQRALPAYMTDPVSVILGWPACLIFGLPGLLLFWVFRRRRRRWR